jgi:iron complex transport system substrate-binding protein
VSHILRGSRSPGARAALALVLLLVSVACRNGGGATSVGSTVGSAPAATPAGQGAFPRKVIDAAGRTIELAAPPARIVSQTLSTDELLFAMIAPSRLVGVSTLARDPAYSNIVAEATALGAPKIETVEQVITLRPNIVFVSSFSRAELVTLLEKSGAPVYRFANFDRIDDVKANIRRLGEAVGAETEAAALVKTMEQRLTAVAARRSRAGVAPRVVSYSPSGFTAGAGTTFDDIVRAAGGVNVVAEQGLKGFPRISAEQVLTWQPDFILVGINPSEREAILSKLKENAAIAATRAMRAGRLVFMPNRALLSTSHHIVDAVELLAAAFDATPVTR